MKHTLKFLILTLFFLFILGPPQAQATLLTLSTHANNDGDNPIDPALLDATLDFSVVGNTLTLAVTNLTPENGDDPALKINEIYFNATSNVQGLALIDVIGADQDEWVLIFSENGFRVGGFGEFDVSLTDGQGNSPHVIGPEDTVTFVIDIITGSGPFSGYNFTTEFTTVSAGGDKEEPVASLAAAKFYGGDNGASSYGATNVPEPVTLMLLGLGGLGLLCRRKKA